MFPANAIAPQIHVRSHELITISSAWPFHKWAIDLTTPKNQETPFILVYGSEAVIPAKIAIPMQCITEFNEEANEIHLRENLNMFEERRSIAAINKASNNQKIAKYYNRLVRKCTFYPGDYV
ncbi:uncharacterized protein [Rutidosis leptorrhynchoides]|uniref:uncharacterized protein n=1 Tax=Rutidosis leptorrhynchoides TaxID=125765 RepID=UPI003A9A3CBF